MKSLPGWAWVIGVLSVVAVAGGAAIPPSYVQDVVLQIGTAGLLLIPILLAERSIGQRLERTAADAAAVRYAEETVARDDMWRDFGQKMYGKIAPVTLATIEGLLTEHGWRRHRDLDGHRLWQSRTRRLALPDLDAGAPLPSAHVRAVIRALGMTVEAFQERYGPDDPTAD